MNYSVNTIKRGAISLTIYEMDVDEMQSIHTYENISESESPLRHMGFHLADVMGLMQYHNRGKSTMFKVAEINYSGIDLVTLSALKEIRELLLKYVDEDTACITRFGLVGRDLDHQRNHVFEALGFKDFNFFCTLENSTVDIYPNTAGLELIHLAQELNLDKYQSYKKIDNIVLFDPPDYHPERHETKK